MLRAVYDQGSITKAANALHITQPAVSHALGRLREKFDDPLFIRHGRQVVPTPFCQGIIASVVKSIETLESTLKGKVGFDISDKPRQVNLGLRDILESIFKNLPSPNGNISNPLKSLLVDSWYDSYLGVVILVRVIDLSLIHI